MIISTLIPSSQKICTKTTLSPQSPERLRKPQTFCLLAFFLISLIWTQQAAAQYTYSCTNCTASVVKVTNVTLKDYNPSTCPPFGSDIFPGGTKAITVQYDVTASERYGLLFLANQIGRAHV